MDKLTKARVEEIVGQAQKEFQDKSITEKDRILHRLHVKTPAVDVSRMAQIAYHRCYTYLHLVIRGGYQVDEPEFIEFIQNRVPTPFVK